MLMHQGGELPGQPEANVSLPVLENTLRDLDDKVLSVRERILEVVDAQKASSVRPDLQSVCHAVISLSTGHAVTPG